MSLVDRITSIQTRKDFVSFVHALSQTLNDNPESWENDDITAYLKAIAAWAEDMDGYYQNRGEPVPITIDWKFIAQLLLAAKSYE